MSWLPNASRLLLALATLAIAMALYVRTRGASLGVSWARPRAAALIFLGAFAASALADGSPAESPLVVLQSALHAAAFLAAIATALLLFTAPRAAPISSRAPASRAPARSPSPAPIPAPPHSQDLDEEPVSTPPPTEAGFLGLVSHELRTPLTAMQLLLDRLADGADELAPRQRKIVERLESNASRLTDLVDSVLYYARIQNGKLVTTCEPFDLSTLATEAVEELRPQAARKSIALETGPAEPRVTIESDPRLVRLVIVNLVSNAVKFTEQGSVAVTATAEGDRRIVRVEDTGLGIDPAEQARIFEPFQNVEPTKQKHQPGIGLGLSLARRIIETLGGEITVRSQLGHGSTFEVSLPAVTTRTAA